MRFTFTLMSYLFPSTFRAKNINRIRFFLHAYKVDFPLRVFGVKMFFFSLLLLEELTCHNSH
jgi:hypothetical protein